MASEDVVTERCARESILAAIGRALPDGIEQRRRSVAARLAGPAAVHPWKAPPPEPEALFALFAARAAAVRAPVERVATPAELPAALIKALHAWELSGPVVAADDPQLKSWIAGAPGLAVRFGNPDPADRIGLVRAIGAVAETGTVLLSSGPNSATSLAYLPEYLIVALPRSVLVAGYDEVVPALHARSDAETLPRTLNFVTGPSRTRDIEELLLIGAHGPRALRIIAVDSV
jgi:L-lactate dehydrogenase complex protein LldG